MLEKKSSNFEAMIPEKFLIFLIEKSETIIFRKVAPPPLPPPFDLRDADPLPAKSRI
jgi:hypothetical protein